MTRFSIVVPVYRVRAYLRYCLDSVLEQSFTDIEVIAVDDASPDGSGDILDEYAASDPRLHVIHLAHNVGLGLAREAGIRAATGEYLLFLDSDDFMAPHALEAISRRIDDTERPDIVLFDYARRYWSRRTVRNQLAHLLREPGPDVFTIDQRPHLLNLLMVVWNKAYRRDFVVAGGFHFPPGYYEDTPWTYPTLLAAQRISILDRVCVLYRQRRESGNILKSRSTKHFDIFEQWNRVWEFLDVNPSLASWRSFLLRREVQHSITILNSPRRLPKDQKRRFFERAHEEYEKHKSAGDVDPLGGLLGLQTRVVMRGRYPAFVVLAVLTRLVRRVPPLIEKLRGALSRAYMSTGRQALRTYYRLQLLLPVDEHLAVYAAYWNRGIACNPYAIYQKAQELAPDVRGVWVVSKPRSGSQPRGVTVVRPGSLAYYRAIARAKYLVNNVNFADIVRKRPGTIHLQTHHGTPLKKMGLDLMDYPVGAAKMSFPKLLNRVDKWDYSLSSNRFSTETWERSYPSSYETLEVGYPRNDRLVRATDEDKRAVRERLGIPLDSDRVVLYTPTFRDYRRDFRPDVDLRELVDAIGPGAVLLVRAHYFDDEDNDALDGLTDDRRLVDVSDYPLVEELCLASDALLTDYSSIMFDYAVLDRPIAIYAYDWDTYVRTRGVNFDLMSEPPGFVARSADELFDGFRSGQVWGDAAAKARAHFRTRFCQLDDGMASERVVRRIFLNQPLPLPMESQAGSGGSERDRAFAEPEGDLDSTADGGGSLGREPETVEPDADPEQDG